ncbi:uncharacterized protein LOC142573340 [Dermacentor variabilis]|uniref:uncharacterized protein LOC142573340 n=1 Tax=Dermacentor variabilis TaxID=34621 RepID=UPI003F5C53AB
MQSTGQLGQMESFDVTASDWTAYKERLTSFLIVNKVPDSDKVHAFLSIIGPRTYGLLKSLTAPDLPSAKSFEQLKSILDAHLAPVPSVIGERAKFYRRAQHEGEPLPEYVAELRKLSQTCQFGASLDEARRDRIVCGLLREDVQRVLFTEGDTLTFSRAVDRALAMEAARKNVAETRVVEALATQLHKVEDDSREAHADLYEVQTRAGKPLLVCYRCGSPSHTHAVCPHINDTCFKCSKKGHIQRACRSSNRQCHDGYKKKRSLKTLKVVTQEPTISISKQGAASRAPIFVKLNINDAPVEMELDTGAAVSIMPFKQFKKRLPSTSYRSTDVTLRTYTGALVRPCGVAVVNVQYSGRTAQLPLYLVDQAGPPLLGREWLHTLRLDWDSIWGLNYISRGQPKWMPAVVMAQTGPVSFKVRVSTPSGCLEWRRHKNQLLQSTTVPAENVVQDDEFSVGPHSDLGSGPAAENSVEGDGFTVGPHSDPGSGQAFSVPPASVSLSPPTSQADTARGDEDRRYPIRNRRPPDRFQAGT